MRHPAVLPAASLLCGVAVGWRWPASVGVPLVVCLVASWLGAVIVVVCRREHVVSPVAACSFLVLGTVLGSHATIGATESSLWQWHQRLRVEGVGSTPDVVEGRLTRDATPTDYGASLNLAVDTVLTPTGRHDVAGGARVAVGGQLAPLRIKDWVEGRHVRLPVTFRQSASYRNPGVTDQQHLLMWRGTSLLGSVKSALLVEVLEPGRWWPETAAVVRAEVRARVSRTVGTFGGRSAGVVTAVLIGDRTGLEPDDRRRLQEAGTYHVIAISGGNIAILSAALLLMLRLVSLDVRWASVVTVGCLAAYASVVGSEASVARATFAASVFLLARACDHRTSALNTLALAATCLVAVSPLTIVDPGFLLTFGATLGLLVGLPPVVERTTLLLGELPRVVKTIGLSVVTMLAATICAELVLFPVAATVFSRVTVAGLLLNFAAIPLMTVAQVSGMLAVAASFVTETGAQVAGYVAHLSATGIVESARLMDVAPWLSRRVPAPPVALPAIYYLGWLVALSAPRRTRAVAAVVVFVTGLLMVLGPVPRLTPLCGDLPRALRVLFLDVDQADATLVSLPSGHNLLVDAGGTARGSYDVGGRIVSPVLWHAGIRRLDYLALTHGHPDHIGGAGSVIADLRPREIWAGVPVPGSDALRDVRAMATDVGAGWRTMLAGDTLAWGEVGFRVLHPPSPDWERQEVRNDDSLVVELRYGDVSVVLPGDISAAVEQTLARSFESASFRVLKVPHHGSRTSSSRDFIDALEPEVAVVSAGRDNPFGHPHPEVVQRYQQAGTTLVQTGEVGAVSVCTNGRAVRIETETGRRVIRRAWPGRP